METLPVLIQLYSVRDDAAKDIRGTLKKLKEMGYVKGTQRGREVYYELAEPLMRLSLQVKEASENDGRGTSPIKLLVDFIRTWYDKESHPMVATAGLGSRGCLHASHGRFEDAIRDFSSCINISNRRKKPVATTLLGRSLAYSCAGMLGKAANDVTDGLRLLRMEKPDPEDTEGLKQYLADLGWALLDLLKYIKENQPSAIDAWLNTWIVESKDYPQLSIPVKLLKVGVDYIKTSDESVLLQLPQEERRIVRQALKLPEENESTDS